MSAANEVIEVKLVAYNQGALGFGSAEPIAPMSAYGRLLSSGLPEATKERRGSQATSTPVK